MAVPGIINHQSLVPVKKALVMVIYITRILSSWDTTPSSIRITQLHRGKKGNDISGRYALIDCRLVTQISLVEINPQRVFFREF